MKLDSTVLYSNDIDLAIKFYTEIIGLELDFKQDGKFASFKFSNDVSLGIKKAVEEREIPGAQTFFISTEDIDEIYQTMKKKGVSFYKELTEESWGKQFSILDPDKNKVLFMKRK